MELMIDSNCALPPFMKRPILFVLEWLKESQKVPPAARLEQPVGEN